MGVKQMNKVISLNKEKKFPLNAELHERIMGVIGEYDGQMSTAECLGVLELTKVHIIKNARKKIINKE